MCHAMKRGLAAANAGADPDAQLCMRRGLLMPCAQMRICAKRAPSARCIIAIALDHTSAAQHSGEKTRPL